MMHIDAATAARSRGVCVPNWWKGFWYVWRFVPMRALLLLLAIVSLAGTPTIGVLHADFRGAFWRNAHRTATWCWALLGSASGVGAHGCIDFA